MRSHLSRFHGLLLLSAFALAPSVVAAQALTPDQLTVLPQVQSASQASSAILSEYPRNLQESGIGGRVQVRFVVLADGTVDPGSVEVVAASVNALGNAAAKAVARIRFKPGQKDGAAVPAVVVMPTTFGAT